MKIKSLRAYAIPVLTLAVLAYAGLAPVPPKPATVAACIQFPGCVVQVASFQKLPSLR
ncbi:hypothetical protein [Pseudomonas auratipiscis]|uniref:Uncharacterized protein n=1 Tax=Pseudomonas auratipiscis TaxID=3115853 RepID=A0AB35WKV4_9PSED|nr:MULTISPECIES: hypothetical protein [unclassified Pseudomonas]MEE1864802.1 hypothetical protein [Pseudomonas sp. 120P]MEE1956257.1 hypothetical protein [Pseudomonas sp. 119P]